MFLFPYDLSVATLRFSARPCFSRNAGGQEDPAMHLYVVLIVCRSYEKKGEFAGPPQKPALSTNENSIFFCFKTCRYLTLGYNGERANAQLTKFLCLVLCKEMASSAPDKSINTTPSPWFQDHYDTSSGVFPGTCIYIWRNKWRPQDNGDDSPISRRRHLSISLIYLFFLTHFTSDSMGRCDPVCHSSWCSRESVSVCTYM